MRSLGDIGFFTVGGSYLIRSKIIPEFYSKIALNDGKIVGKVNDIVGPIMDPHIVLKPTAEVAKNHTIIKGKELFEKPKKLRYKGDKKWKKGK